MKLASKQSSIPPQRSTRLLLVFVILMIATISINTWWAVQQDKQLTLDSEVSNGMVVVRLLEEHATQTLQEAVNTLDQLAALATANAAANPTDADFEISINRIITTSEAKQAKFLQSLLFINRDGLSWITLPDVPPHTANLRERRHVAYLIANNENRDVLIDHPYPSRYDSQLVIPLARNIYANNGQWLGIISIDLRLSYLGKFYARAAKDNNASVALIADEGYIFVRSPFEARYLDRDISDSPVLPRLRAGQAEGTFNDESFLDDEYARLYTYRKITGFPIITVYGRDFDTLLMQWHKRTRDRILFAGGTFTFILVMAFLLHLYIGRLRQSREFLRESETRFVGLFQHSPVPLILIKQSDNRIAEVNDAWLTLFGHEKKHILNCICTDLNIWEDAKQRLEIVNQLSSTEYISYHDVLLRHQSGQELTCLVSARVFIDRGQSWIIFTVVDVSQQRRIETEIRELNFELEDRVASRTRNLEISNQNLSNALASLNDMQAELIRTEKMASLGQLMASVAHEINTPISAMKSNGKNIADSLNYVLHSLSQLYRMLDQLEFNLFNRMLDQAKEGAQVFSSREERLIIQKLVAQLEQAGVADTRQTAYVLVQLRAQEKVGEFLPLLRHPSSKFILDLANHVATIMHGTSNINTAVGQVAKIVFALKSFSRSSSNTSMESVDLRSGIETVLIIYHYQIKKGVELVCQYEDLPPIYCFPDELIQVWINLIHNALQAMNHKGTLTIEIRRINNEAVVSIGDTGSGIPEAIRGKIFDPFFTTKPIGEGSGLGLDIVRKIVEKHKGRIEFQSQIEVGTTFFIYLPIGEM